MSFFTSESGGPGLAIGLLVLILLGVGGGALVQGRFKATSGRADMRKDSEVDEKVLAHLRQNVEGARAKWDKAEGLQANHKEWETLQEKVKNSAAVTGTLSEQKGDLEQEVVRVRKEFDDYRARYCRQVRTAANGEKLEELSSRQGKVYRKVTIRRVTETGMEFSHADGLATLGPEELADSWRERFQW